MKRDDSAYFVSGDGYLHLGYQIVTQAVVDYKVLRKRGIIGKGGKVVDVWPRKYGKLVYIQEYSYIQEVESLILWLKESLDNWLIEIGASVSGDVVRRELGIQQ